MEIDEVLLSSLPPIIVNNKFVLGGVWFNSLCYSDFVHHFCILLLVTREEDAHSIISLWLSDLELSG